MSWAAKGAADYVTWRDIEEADAAGDLFLVNTEYPGSGSPSEPPGHLDWYATTELVEMNVWTDAAAVDKSAKQYATKGDLQAWAGEAVEIQGFSAVHESASCPDTRIALSWSYPAGYDEADLDYSDDGGVSWFNIPLSVGATSYSHGVTSGVSYDYRIRPVTTDPRAWVEDSAVAICST
ncbi:MAG TPA: hypothetical protein VK966_01260 [Longimicrobiales bacterium]|nr:hypothetical protein [Longimicrobiales bacterium]